jgi:hypothetical protein
MILHKTTTQTLPSITIIDRGFGLCEFQEISRIISNIIASSCNEVGYLQVRTRCKTERKYMLMQLILLAGGRTERSSDSSNSPCSTSLRSCKYSLIRLTKILHNVPSRDNANSCSHRLSRNRPKSTSKVQTELTKAGMYASRTYSLLMACVSCTIPIVVYDRFSHRMFR